MKTKLKSLKETLVSSETAKLAKEKGFDLGCWAWYVDTTLAGHEPNKPQFRDNIFVLRDYNKDTKTSKNFISAPTQFDLQLWLKKTHKIYVTISNDTSMFYREQSLRFALNLIS